MAYADQARQAGETLFMGKKGNLQTQTGMNNNAAQSMAQMLQQYGQTGAREIDASFEGLLGDMGRNREAATGMLNQQTGRVGQGYQDAANASLAVRDEGRSYLNNLLQGIGMGGGQQMAEANAPLEQLAAQLYERNTRYGQDAQTALGNWATQHDVLYGDQMVNARGRQAEAQTGFAAEIAKGLQQAEADRVKRELELQQALSALLGEQSQFELGFANQLVDRDTKVAMQQAELQQQAAQHAASLALEREKMAAAERAANNPDDKAIEWARLQFQKDQAAQQQGNWQSEFNRAGEKEPVPYEGVQGARRYASDVGAGSSVVDYVSRLMGQAPADQDPYIWATQNYNPNRQYAESDYAAGDPQNQQWVRDIASILYGNYGR